MGSILQIAFKIFLLHLLLYAHNGNGGATTNPIAEENANVLKLPNMHRNNNHMMHHLDPSSLVFFTPNDLKLGKKLPIYFPMKDPPPLLSKNEANSIPFSYTHLPHLLRLFSFSPDSPQAKSMENTLKQCEIDPIKGETKVCATSLESTIDFVHKTFGLETQFRVLQTNHIEKSGVNLDNYTILSEPEEIRVPNMVACHTLPYPYRVFYCHSQKSENKLFMVSLGGDNGGRVEAVSVCHMDTSQWSKDHASFRVLETKPGASPVCHFFRADVLVYVPLPSLTST
ncbi:BURP domain-containing protein BNM2A-like [Euphorbia lathyris]|uniref:BURP domain-containing protein BNM2A-like n=1 Tax=Euphorbia lathyris TaxID=212925 RepID=UPI0033137116